jgi:hypothetical protein
MGSFVFGYANNCIAGTLAQSSFQLKFLTGSNANSIIGGIMGAYVPSKQISLEDTHRKTD